MRPDALALIAIGVMLRIGAFVNNRSLWYDEASLALNIAFRSPGDVLSPLHLGQAAPPGYLFLVQLTTSLFGISEPALRLPALVAGIVMLPLAWLAARRVLPHRAALLVLALLALSPLLIYYSNEVKPYAFDGMVAALLVYLALRVDADPSRMGGYVALGAAGAIGAWLSTPSVFVLAGVWVALTASVWRQADRPRIQPFLVVGVVWVASFGLAYLLSYRRVAHDPYLARYWAGNYLRFDGSLPTQLQRVFGGLVSATYFHRDAFRNLPQAIRLAFITITLGLIAWGCIALVRRGAGRVAAIAALPVAATVAAYLDHRYPITARLLCYLTPGLTLLLAAGLDRAVGRRAVPFWAASIVLLIPAAYHAVVELRVPYGDLEDPRDVTRTLAETLEETGEPVYVSARGARSWAYYATDWRTRDDERFRFLVAHGDPPDGLVFDDHPSQPGYPSEEVQQLQIRRPRWMEVYGVYSGIESRAGYDERATADAGWAAHEAARIRALGRPCVWGYFVRTMSGESAGLLDELRRRGATVDRTLRGPLTAAMHFCFRE